MKMLFRKPVQFPRLFKGGWILPAIKPSRTLALLVTPFEIVLLQTGLVSSVVMEWMPTLT
jgi:hypothetical protein